MRQGPNTLLTVLIVCASFSVCVAQTEKYPLQRGDENLISELSWSPRNDLILTSSADENASHYLLRRAGPS